MLKSAVFPICLALALAGGCCLARALAAQQPTPPSPFVGIWAGKLATSAGALQRIVVTISQDAQGHVTGEIRVGDPPASAEPLDLLDIRGDNLHLRCDDPSSAIKCSYSGRLDYLGRAIVGTFDSPNLAGPLVLARTYSVDALFGSKVTPEDRFLDGTWSGDAVAADGQPQHVVFRISIGRNGRFRAALRQLGSDTGRTPAIVQYLNGDADLSVGEIGAHFHGAVSADNSSIQGTWNVDGKNYALTLVKAERE